MKFEENTIRSGFVQQVTYMLSDINYTYWLHGLAICLKYILCYVSTRWLLALLWISWTNEKVQSSLCHCKDDTCVRYITLCNIQC